MITYIARRVVVAIPTLWGVATVVFFMARLLPGDPARVIAGVLASPEDVERIRQQMGLDQPLWVQYLDFMGSLLRVDLGTSAHTNAPVIEEIGSRIPYTAELAVVALVIAVVVGILAGIAAAVRRNTILDLLISGFSVFGVSMPVYWLGLMLIILFAIELHLFPAAGADEPTSIVMPALTLALFSVGLIARMTRSSMLEVLGQDYIRTARAKGAPVRTVIFRHALRNAFLPILTVIGLQFGSLLGGAVVTETVFAWPGVGRLLVDSIFFRDYPVVQGLVLMFGVTFVAVNLIVDLLYAYVDPRIHYS
ncbi:MAG TPA: nickel ABC transporter permease [Candidatus Dormibacteraeota bacterium]|nr:nickel ABC transporter permease [Candidatus Dormibacteraeota bacterium]